MDFHDINTIFFVLDSSLCTCNQIKKIQNISKTSVIAIKGDDLINLIALRKAKIVYNFGLSEFSRVKVNCTLPGQTTLPFILT